MTNAKEPIPESGGLNVAVHPFNLTRIFHSAFGAPINHKVVLSPSVTERELRLKLILEEFLELCEAMGFGLVNDFGNSLSNLGVRIGHIEGSRYDPVETADALGDLNVVVNGTSLVLGIPQPAVDMEIFYSNMSKLGEDGEPIVNGVTPGYRDGDANYAFDQPVGKILKGPNFRKPNILRILFGLGHPGDES